MSPKPNNALVSGGGRGIGRAIVEQLMEEGYQVTTCGRGERPENLSGSIHWVKCDVSIPASASALMNEARETMGSVSLLVNNAGVQVEKSVLESTDEDWDLVVGVNCRGVFNLCRASLSDMQQQGGSIINIGSISGVVSDPTMALYNASKAFVHGLTRSIAIDHGPNVRCNSILPGWIMTAMAEDAFALAANPEAAMKDALSRHPVGRFGQPQDIANTVSWLASDKASYVNGQCFTIDGGMTAASPLQPGLF